MPRNASSRAVSRRSGSRASPHRWVALLVAGALLLGACRAAPPVEPTATAGVLQPGDQPPVRLVENPDRWPHDRHELLDWSLAGDLLEARIQYGGGCEVHEFALLVLPIFMESYPVQMRGSLAHDSKGDLCRALIRRTLTFDLTPIKQAYQRAYGQGPATVVLHVDGWTRAVRYAF